MAILKQCLTAVPVGLAALAHWRFSRGLETLLLVSGVWFALAAFLPTCQLIFAPKGYFSQWKEMRAAFAPRTETGTRVARNTFFYDLSVEYLISYIGFAHVFLFCLKHTLLVRPEVAAWISHEDKMDKSTETNHNLTMYYCKPYVRGDPRFRNPTKWCYRLLESRPFLEQTSCAAELEKHADTIIAEYQHLKAEQMKTHPDQRTEIARGKWSWLKLYGVGGKDHALCELVPKTTAVIESLRLNVPFGFAFFSQIAPRTHITQHTGSSNIRIRLHLGIDVPVFENGNSGKPFCSSIRVGTQSRVWEQSKVMVFDDSFEHEVNYNSGNPRTVLIVDTWHPDMTDEEIAIFSLPIFGKFGRQPKTGFKKVYD